MQARSRSPPPYLHRIVPMSVCANFEPNRPSRVAAYTGQHRTEAILEKYNIDVDYLTETVFCFELPCTGYTYEAVDLV
jgi:hypothetical protein